MLQALHNPHITSKLIEDTINQLGKTVKSLSIHWIEAHKGHAGNEKADEMARAAEFKTIMDETIDTPAGYDKQKLWRTCYDLWTKEWKQLTTCRMTKIFFPKPDKNKTQNCADSAKKNRKLLTTYSMSAPASNKPDLTSSTTNLSSTHSNGTPQT